MVSRPKSQWWLVLLIALVFAFAASVAEAKTTKTTKTTKASKTTKTSKTSTTTSSAPLIGTVVSVDTTAGTLLVKDKDGTETTVTTDASTQITLDGKTVSLGDLTAGMFVLVTPASGTATRIDAKSPPPLMGVIVSVDTAAETLVVKQPDGTEVTVTTDDETVITLDGNVATLSSLTAGSLVMVTPPTGIADKVDAKSPCLMGIIESVDTSAGTLLIKEKDGTEVTVTMDANTLITLDGTTASLSDLKAGMMVMITPVTGTAGTIDAKSGPPLMGIIESIDTTAGTILIKQIDNTEVTVTTDSETQITIDGTASTLSSLTAGLFVVVTPPTGVADKIEAKSAASCPPDKNGAPSDKNGTPPDSSGSSGSGSTSVKSKSSKSSASRR